MTNLSEPNPADPFLVVCADERDHGQEELEEQDEDGVAGATHLGRVLRAGLHLGQLNLLELGLGVEANLLYYCAALVLPLQNSSIKQE